MLSAIQHIPPEEYHRAQALSNSGISKLLDCPAKFKAWQDGEREEQTEAMLIGSAFHCLTLEPEEFSRRYHVKANPGSTRAGKEEKAAAENNGKTILTRRQYDEIRPLARGLFGHSYIAALIKNPTSVKEASIFWEEEIDAQVVPCKARLDLIFEKPGFGDIVLDLKSMRSAAPGEFAREIYFRGYHRQAWWYMRALAMAGRNPRAFLLAVADKSAPEVSALFQIEDRAIARGGRECRRALAAYAECAARGRWPGYPERIVAIDLPEWVYRKEDNNESEQTAY